MEKKAKSTKTAKVVRATKLQTALLTIIALGTIASTMYSYGTYTTLNRILGQDNPNAKAASTESISKKYAKGQTMQAALKTGKPIVALFYADWCGYCKRFSPTFNNVAKKGTFKSNLAVAYVNGDDPANSEFMKEYNIQAFPTVYMIHPQKNIKELVSNSDLFAQDAETKLLDKFVKFAETHK